MYLSVDSGQNSTVDHTDLFIRRSWKVLRLIGGGAVAASNAIKIVSALYNMDTDAGLPRQMIIDSWVFLFGLVMVLIEDFRFSGDFRRGLTRRRLYYYCRFLFLPPGRGYWYMLVATLLLARTSLTDFDLLLGAYVAILACISVSVGHYTAWQLQRLKNTFASEMLTRRALAQMPSKEPEELEPEEFRQFCREMGVHFSAVGLDMAVGLLDADQNGSVSHAEFVEWWLMDL